MCDRELRWMASLALILAAGLVVAAEPADEAWKAYQAYRTAFTEAASIDELVPLLAAERAAQVKDTPEDEKGMMFAMIQEMSKGMSELEVVGTTVEGDMVVFEVKGAQNDGAAVVPLTGTVTMVREGGIFKVSQESFKMGDGSPDE